MSGYPNKEAPANAPRNVKNNNPGSLRISRNGWRGKRPESENTDKQFEQFDTMANGARAHLKNLQTYFKRGERSIHAIIDDGDGLDWSPAFENDSQAYINYLSKELKVKPDQILEPTLELLVDLAFAMSRMENGKTKFITRKIYVDGFNSIG